VLSIALNKLQYRGGGSRVRRGRALANGADSFLGSQPDNKVVGGNECLVADRDDLVLAKGSNTPLSAFVNGFSVMMK
jgi:hypothetical protein